MYRTIDAKFWTDPKVRELSTTNKLLFLYLITSPHAHFSGLYYIPNTTVSHETGIRLADVGKGIDTLSSVGIVMPDTLSELIWVVNMFQYQSHSETLLKNIGKHLADLHKSPLILAFLERYSDLDIPYRYPIATLCDKEQEQEQEKEQEQYQEELHLVGKTENEPLENVLKRLNQLREKNWEWAKYKPLTSKHKTNTEHITALLNDGSTEDELIVVLEYIAAKNKGHEPSKPYFNCTTPFRPKHWENNLAMATDWDAKGRPATKPSSNGSGKSQKERFGTEPPVSDYANVGRET